MLFRRVFFRLLFLFLFCSCNREAPALFPVRGTDAALAALSRNAAAGTLDFAKPEKLDYRFQKPPVIAAPASLTIEYAFSVSPAKEIKDHYQLVLDTGGGLWALPMDLGFLGIDGAIANGAAANGAIAGADGVIHYAVPIEDSFSGRFSIAFTPIEDSAKGKLPRAGLPLFQIRSLEIGNRWFGYYANAGGDDRAHFFTTPFVFKQDDAHQGAARYVLDPPPAVTQNLTPEFTVDLSSGKTAVLESAGLRFEASPFLESIRVPFAVLSANSGPLAISGDRVRSFRLTYAAPPPFPQPITADPGLIIAWPVEQWRNRAYEVFRWEQFPSLLIFDTADYAVQDRMFKRLAFFTEKAGFRGRLAPDAEIAELHGWNAHDYRAEDLARFFEAARIENFPLLPEERELEKILRNEGIIRVNENGGNAIGDSAVGGSAISGGIISISRESADYLRSMFLVHEAFHGLFFIDEDFRAFSRRRWNLLPSPAKRFITSYFDYQHYDIKDEYLLVNEFMAHILQHPVSQAGRYFGETLPSRIDSSWRRTTLPPKDEAAGVWPVLAETFTKEAEAFSAYVNQRWGLAAGRVRQLTLRAR
jgi:hypothetical protein